MTTARTNRRVAAVASALCLALIVTIAILSATPSRDAFGRRPSTFFTDPSGARAIYLVLQRVLPSVEQWRLPISELKPPSPQNVATLIAMGPNPFGQDEANALDAWIVSGGQLILAANTDWSVQKNSADRATKDFLARHGMTAGAVYDRPLKSGVVDAAVIKEVGRGRIVYVPDS